MTFSIDSASFDSFAGGFADVPLAVRPGLDAADAAVEAAVVRLHRVRSAGGFGRRFGDLADALRARDDAYWALGSHSTQDQILKEAMEGLRKKAQLRNLKDLLYFEGSNAREEKAIQAWIDSMDGIRGVAKLLLGEASVEAYQLIQDEMKKRGSLGLTPRSRAQIESQAVKDGVSEGYQTWLETSKARKDASKADDAIAGFIPDAEDREGKMTIPYVRDGQGNVLEVKSPKGQAYKVFDIRFARGDQPMVPSDVKNEVDGRLVQELLVSGLRKEVWGMLFKAFQDFKSGSVEMEQHPVGNRSYNYHVFNHMGRVFTLYSPLAFNDDVNAEKRMERARVARALQAEIRKAVLVVQMSMGETGVAQMEELYEHVRGLEMYWLLKEFQEVKQYFTFYYAQDEEGKWVKKPKDGGEGTDLWT